LPGISLLFSAPKGAFLYPRSGRRIAHLIRGDRGDAAQGAATALGLAVAHAAIVTGPTKPSIVTL
jgi:hypothetical protein